MVKAGEFKEAGTFMRSWSKQERESLQGLVNDAYMLFVSDVAEARNLDINKKRRVGKCKGLFGTQCPKNGANR